MEPPPPLENGEFRVGEESNDNPENIYGNKYFMAATTYRYSAEKNADGEHWHYGEDGKTEIWTD